MSSESPIEIPPPDSMHLSAATGWMQLGNTDEALLDLDKISDRHRGHYEVLHLEWHIHAQRRDWERCAELGGYMVEQYPNSSAGWINQANSLFYLIVLMMHISFLNRSLSVFLKTRLFHIILPVMLVGLEILIWLLIGTLLQRRLGSQRR